MSATNGDATGRGASWRQEQAEADRSLTRADGPAGPPGSMTPEQAHEYARQFYSVHPAAAARLLLGASNSPSWERRWRCGHALAWLDPDGVGRLPQNDLDQASLAIGRAVSWLARDASNPHRRQRVAAILSQLIGLFEEQKDRAA